MFGKKQQAIFSLQDHVNDLEDQITKLNQEIEKLKKSYGELDQENRCLRFFVKNVKKYLATLEQSVKEGLDK